MVKGEVGEEVKPFISGVDKCSELRRSR